MTSDSDAIRRQALLEAEGLSDSALDTLPYGMIQLDREGNVLRYNQREAVIANVDQKKQLGRSFFNEVAPCTKVKEFYGRFVEGLEKRKLYETFTFIFKFKEAPKNVTITLMYSEKTDSVWVLVSLTEVVEPG